MDDQFDPERADESSEDIVRTELGPLSAEPGHPGLLAVAALYLVITVASGLFWSWSPARQLAVSYQTAIVDGQVWRLLTAVFVHADLYHLLANTPMFLIFGYYLWGYFGPLVFPGLCLVVGAGSNYLTVLFMEPSRYLVGMSGMIYGMVGLWLVYFMRFESGHRFGHRLMRAVAFSLVVMFPTTYSPNTSYLAHGWGFLVGIILGIVTAVFLTPKTAREQGQSDRSVSAME